MGLKDLANSILENFDAKTDNPNAGGFDNLPDGEYDVTLAKVEHKVFERTGWECLSLENEVTTGEAAGRKEFVNLGFDETSTPEFVLNKNIKLVAKLAAVIGLSLTDEDWEDETTLAEAFQDGMGSQYILTVTSSPNKKDPTKPYRNFDFVAYDDESENPNEQYPVDINDEDLPY